MTGQVVISKGSKELLLDIFHNKNEIYSLDN